MRNDLSAFRVHPADGDMPQMTEYRSDLLGESYFRFIHRSGMPVLVFPKSMTTCSAMIVVRYGAQDACFATADGRKVITPEGVAHFLEHKLFGDEDGGTVDEIFSSMGADVNAWTDYDKTAYFFNTTEQKEEALYQLLRFVSRPYFTPESVAREQGIIAQEIRMIEDNPWEKLHRTTMRGLYQRHPVRRSICGTEASIEQITAQVLYDCYYAFYRPENMYLVVCGDITPQSVAKIADRALGDWQARLQKQAPERGRRISFADDALPEVKAFTDQANVSRPIFQIAWKDTAISTDPGERLRREIAMDILSEILFSRAGIFYNRLFEQGLLSPTYSYGYSIMPEVAYHSISGETDDPDRVLREYWDFIDEQKRIGINEQDFERCRRVIYAGYISGFDFTDDIADLMVETEGDDRDVFDSLAHISSLTLQEVQALFDTSLSREETICSILKPKESEDV